MSTQTGRPMRFKALQWVGTAEDRRNHQARHHAPGAPCVVNIAGGVRIPGTILGPAGTPAGSVRVMTAQRRQYVLPLGKVEVAS